MTDYHHRINIEMGCGCTITVRIALETLRDEFHGDDPALLAEPSGRTVVAALAATLLDPEVEEMLTADHERKGQEKLMISISTKVGAIPEGMDVEDV